MSIRLTNLHQRKRRPGFTLVELLVVIAIIGVLVALLLPAVQAAREAARRVSCINNITQLGLSLHNYEFHYESLPAGVTNPDGPIRNEPQGNHVSWIVRILPYMEQNALSRHFDQAAGAYADANSEVRSSRIRILECPSDGTPFINDAEFRRPQQLRRLSPRRRGADRQRQPRPLIPKQQGQVFRDL